MGGHGRAMRLTATAPGRVNLIGDHVDYAGGFVLPVAVDLATTVTGERGGDEVVLTSASEAEQAVVPIDVEDPAAIRPGWARYVAGVVAELRPREGFVGEVRSTLPAGAGLSSSAALEVAVALALGAPAEDPVALARLCQQAEQRATGVPCGIMDQLTSAAGVARHALLIDCDSLTVEPVPVPDRAEIVVVHSGEERALASSAYGTRRAEVEVAEVEVGPLREAVVDELSTIADPVARRRARHVVTEIDRVRSAAAALASANLEWFGELMVASHASLRDDFAVSTPALDRLVDQLMATPGVWGARLTGAGFGGCVVAVCEPGAVDLGRFEQAWKVVASAGARLEMG